jgi:hypothetical protein
MERIAGELAALARDADRRFPTPEGRAVVSEDPTVEPQDESAGPVAVVAVPAPNEDAALADDAGPDDEAEFDVEDLHDDDFDDEDFALDEEGVDEEGGGGDTGSTVRYEVPGSAELQITRVLPRAGGHVVPRH